MLTLVLVALTALVHRVWDRDLSVPFAHSGDLLAHAAVLKSTGWTGTPGPSTLLGAPHGVSWVDMPSGGDRVHLVALRVLRALTGDAVTALNLYLLAAVVLVGLVTYLVVRRLGVGALSAGVASVVFAVAPVHFARLEVGHVFLAAYFSVPVGVALALWASGATFPPGYTLPFHERRPRWLLASAAVLLVGSSSPYYAIFAAIVVLGVGAVVALGRGRLRALVRPVLLGCAVLAVLVANVAGEAIARSGGGEAGVRLPLDSDTYGLRVTQMLLPVHDHRIGPLADWADTAFRVLAPGDRGAAVGLVSLGGLAVLAIWALRRVGASVRSAGPGLAAAGSVEPGPPEPGPLERGAGGDPVEGRRGVLFRLALVVAVVLVVATVGGLGMVLATVGFTQARAWSRMAVFAGFAGVVVAAMALDALRARHRPSQAAAVGAAALLVLVALVDQVGTGATADRSAEAAAWATDAEVASALDATLGDGEQVFQLPVAAFPAEAPVGDIGANALLGPAIAGPDTLRWSAGALAGRSGDWQRSLATQEPDLLVDALAAADFGAILIDRRGDPDAAIESELRSELGGPDGESDDGTRAWWDLRPRRAELIADLGDDRVAGLGRAVVAPVGVVVEGSPGIRSTAEPLDRHVGPDATIRLTHDAAADRTVGAADASPRPMSVSFTLSGEPGAEVQISVPGIEPRVVELRDGPVPVEVSVEVPAGGDVGIRLRTDAAPLTDVAAGWGDLRLEVGDLIVLDERVTLEREQLDLSDS